MWEKAEIKKEFENFEEFENLFARNMDEIWKSFSSTMKLVDPDTGKILEGPNAHKVLESYKATFYTGAGLVQNAFLIYFSEKSTREKMSAFLEILLKHVKQVDEFLRQINE